IERGGISKSFFCAHQGSSLATPSIRLVSQISNALRNQVRDRARNLCEYCLLPEALLPAHEPDHIIAPQHRGLTTIENLALACFDCNRRKGSNTASVDPDTGEVVQLF